MLTLDRLKELLSYDPETGDWTRLVSRGGPKGRVGDIAGSLNGAGYVQLAVDSKIYLSSRLAFFYMTGGWPAGLVDHKDRVRSNDRWNNLRPATRSQNNSNCGARANNSLGVKGVNHNSKVKSRPYQSTIRVNGKKIHLGYFETLELASEAYEAAARQHFGEFAAAA